MRSPSGSGNLFLSSPTTGCETAPAASIPVSLGCGSLGVCFSFFSATVFGLPPQPPTAAASTNASGTTDAIRESPDAYTTPALLMTSGQPQIVISGGDYVTAHDPDSGEEIWRAGGLNPRKDGNYRIVGSPVVVGQMVYAPSRKTPLLALRAGGAGDITTSHLEWAWDGAAAPDVVELDAEGST